ncbi:MAG: SUF system NifU family Fe-S cluster assembly protein [Candidatus Micrarchaeota archaeon]
MADYKEEIYRQNILDHYRSPRNFKKLAKADARAEVSNPSCGDRFAVQIRLSKDGKVEDIGFTGSGCAISMAAASMLSERVLGRKAEEARALDKKFVLDLLGIDPGPSRLKCTLLGLETVQKALGKKK